MSTVVFMKRKVHRWPAALIGCWVNLSSSLHQINSWRRLSLEFIMVIAARKLISRWREKPTGPWSQPPWTKIAAAVTSSRRALTYSTGHLYSTSCRIKTCAGGGFLSFLWRLCFLHRLYGSRQIKKRKKSTRPGGHYAGGLLSLLWPA